MIQQIPNR